jgi:hypothetical protein
MFGNVSLNINPIKTLIQNGEVVNLLRMHDEVQADLLVSNLEKSFSGLDCFKEVTSTGITLAKFTCQFSN